MGLNFNNINSDIFRKHLHEATKRVYATLGVTNFGNCPKKKNALRHFAYSLNETLPKHRKDQNEWLVGLYITGKLNHILIPVNPKIKKHKPKKKPAPRRKKAPTAPRRHKIDRSAFYLSDEWITLKTSVLRHYGCKCMKCYVTNVEMHVDHIKPRSKHPKLELVFDNLQVLCRDCNMEKSNLNEIDYRPRIG